MQNTTLTNQSFKVIEERGKVNVDLLAEDIMGVNGCGQTDICKALKRTQTLTSTMLKSLTGPVDRILSLLGLFAREWMLLSLHRISIRRRCPIL